MNRRVPARLLAVGTAIALVVGAGLTGLGAAAAGPTQHTTAPFRTQSPATGGRAAAFTVPSATVPSATVAPTRNITKKPGAQSETTVAIDPTNPNHLIASANDLTTPN
jgi:hypothetical protein